MNSSPVTGVPTTAPSATRRPVPDHLSKPARPLSYFQTLRPVRSGRWWRSLVGIVGIVFGYLLLGMLLPMAAVMIEIATGQRAGFGAGGAMIMTPLMMLSVNISAAALIPMAMLLDRLLYGRSGTLHSVRGVLRSGWLLRSVLILMPIFATYAIAGLWIFPQMPGSTDQMLWWLLIVLLTTPFQAAGEEYGFRGFLGRIIGSWFGGVRIATGFTAALTAVVFMIAHGSLDPWLLAYYLVFGVVMSLVTWRTGGLEAAIVLHGANNVTMMVAGIFTSDMATGFDRSIGVGGPFLLIQMGVIAGLGVLISVVAARLGVPHLTKSIMAEVRPRVGSSGQAAQQ